MTRPTEIKLLDDDTFQIVWDDGRDDRFPLRLLRETCPCATCREKNLAESKPSDKLELTILSPAEVAPLRLLGVKAVGNYAYSIAYSDGHDTGIYTLEFLRRLGDHLHQSPDETTQETPHTTEPA